MPQAADATRHPSAAGRTRANPEQPWLERFARSLGPLGRERAILRQRLGYWPRIRRPRTFNERLAHLRFIAPTDWLAPFADKLAVRAYVRDAVGPRHLPTLLAAADSVHAMPWSTLRPPFILKATHGSGFCHRVLTNDPRELDVARETASRWLWSTHGLRTHERWYSLIPPRLIAEPLLTDDRFGSPLDFKVFVFHGRARFIQVDSDYWGARRRIIYDAHWRPQPFGIRHPTGNPIPPPNALEDMIAVAQAIARPFDFARIDMYCPSDGPPLFGEITFAPGAGRQPFLPDAAYDFVLGQYW